MPGNSHLTPPYAGKCWLMEATRMRELDVYIEQLANIALKPEHPVRTTSVSEVLASYVLQQNSLRRKQLWDNLLGPVFQRTEKVPILFYLTTECIKWQMMDNHYVKCAEASFTVWKSNKPKVKEERCFEIGLSGCALHFVASCWCRGIVISISFFTKLLAFTEHYSVLLTDPLSPYALVTHWGPNWQLLSVPQV